MKHNSQESYIDFATLARLVRGKRGNVGLRLTAEAIGEVSPSTLSRIEGQRMQDLNVSTFLRVCDWAEVNPAELIISERQTTTSSTIDTVQTQLRAAKDLDPRTAQILANIVRGAYDAVREEGNNDDG